MFIFIMKVLISYLNIGFKPLYDIIMNFEKKKEFDSFDFLINYGIKQFLLHLCMPYVNCYIRLYYFQ